MLIAVLADLHANDFALERIENDLRHALAERRRARFDALWLLGDLVGYLPWTVETLTRLKRWQDELAADLLSLAGNHDAILFDDWVDPHMHPVVEPSLALARQQLDQRPDLRAWLETQLTRGPQDLDQDSTRRLRYRALLTIEGVQLALCHSRFPPEHFMEYLRGFDPRARFQSAEMRRLVTHDLDAVFGAPTGATSALLLCAHSHLQFAWQRLPGAEPEGCELGPQPTELPASAQHLIGVGSVGVQRDYEPSSAQRVARYLLLEVRAGHTVIEVRAVPMSLWDVRRAALSAFAAYPDNYDPSMIQALLRHIGLL